MKVERCRRLGVKSWKCVAVSDLHSPMIARHQRERVSSSLHGVGGTGCAASLLHQSTRMSSYVPGPGTGTEPHRSELNILSTQCPSRPAFSAKVRHQLLQLRDTQLLQSPSLTYSNIVLHPRASASTSIHTLAQLSHKLAIDLRELDLSKQAHHLLLP
jgi:hypothetical protein